MGKSILYIVCSFIVLPGLLPVQAMAKPIRLGAIRVGLQTPLREALYRYAV